MIKQTAAIIEAARLYLRDLTLDDIGNLFALDSDPDVMKYLGRSAARTIEEIKPGLQKKLDYNIYNPGLGFWAAVEKTSGAFIGQFSLAHIEMDQTKEIELGFRLLKNFWNMGLATEMGRRLLKHGFDDLKLEKISALAHPDNIVSQKVLEKIGLKFIRSDFFYNTRVNFFETTRSQYSKKISVAP